MQRVFEGQRSCLFTTLFCSKVYVGFVVKIHHKNSRSLGREVPDDTPISSGIWMERIQLTPNMFVGCRPTAQEGL